MSAVSHTDWTVYCNGTGPENLPCTKQAETYSTGSTTATQVRKLLRRDGWLVSWRNPETGRREDYCPEHRPDQG